MASSTSRPRPPTSEPHCLRHSGQLRGTSVLFKVYLGLRAASPYADLMASNELSTHSFLQSSSSDRC
ncbi:hypothetical protein vseg_017330 [Gypsophila vaccaria]